MTRASGSWPVQTMRRVGRRLDRTLLQAGHSRSIRTIARMLDRATPHWFLGAGSCLGYLRYGRVMDEDDDIDLGIYDPAFDIRAFAKRLPVTRYLGLGHWTNQVTISLETDVEVYVLVDHAGQLAETLYFYSENKLKYLHYPKEIFAAGVERGKFCGVECNVLKRAHEYCVLHYGDDYLTPNPGYNWWKGPRNAAMVPPEGMFEEQFPCPTVTDGWPLSFRPATIARRGLRRLDRLFTPKVATPKS